MGLRGELQYLNCYISDVNYVVDSGGDIADMETTLSADPSSIFFDSRTADAITMKANLTINTEPGEQVMNRGVAPDKVTFSFIAVGLDAVANRAKKAAVDAIKGLSKYVYFYDPDTGSTTKIHQIPIMINTKKESNAKGEYTISGGREVAIDDYTMDLA